MNTFKRKSLYAALAGVSALGVTGAAQAVSLNPNGLGQVLIYPYYTTRADATGNAYASLLSVVNTTSSAKAVKVRFLEGKNSREVLDFNLFLSKHDVWTAAILPSTTGGALVGTLDKSCILPTGLPAGGQNFVNFAYVGTVDDKGGGSLDRTKEGYVEILEMATFPTESTTSSWVTHDATGTPACDKLIADGPAFNQVQSDANDLTGTGNLFGGMTLINANDGTDFTEDAVALENFLVNRRDYQAPGNIKPDLRDANPPVSQVIAFNSVFTSTWPTIAIDGNPDPVSAVLMHDQVMNEYILDAGTHSGTDWVVTFPTKRYYVNVGTGNAPKLFQRNFNRTDGSCDDVTLALYDREEQQLLVTDFSPPPPTQTNSLCWEANVITFNNSNVLGSTNSASIPTGFEHGWLNLGFSTLISGADPFVHELSNTDTSITFITGSTTSGQTVTYIGLPVVGFAVQTFVNGTLPGGVLSNYGGNFIHKYTTNIFFF